MDNGSFIVGYPPIMAFLIMVCFAAAAVIVCSCKRSQKKPEALLPNEHVGHLHGLKRDALEDPSLEASKWACNICSFRNDKERLTCVLCRTSRAVFLLVAPEFTEGVLLLEQLNDPQRSARLRNQWNRGFDKDKRVVWKSHRDYLSHPEQYYTVVRTHTGSSLDLVALPSESGTLTTLRGEVLPAWWIYQLRAIQDKSFSLKYAWMVNQIALAYSNYTKIKVYRSKLFEESIQIIMHIPLNQLCTLTKISLLGESGIDAGGVAREWYMLLTTALFEPKQGLFVVNKSDQSFSVNPNSARDHGSKHLERFHAIGRLLGRAIVDGQVLPFHFSVPLLKILLGYPVSMDDIRYVDPTIYSSLRYVRDAEDVDNLSLTFSVSLDASTEVDLIPNGRNVAVTNANKADYVDRMVRYLLFGSVAPQLESLVQGLYEVLPPELLMAFDYKELELVLCGFSEIDVADWKRYCGE
ncbi:hypothetical protein AeNC1_017098 [Aphanomyces euteiches]|nr:hypothetical protein AeNC1_017098 [Aphanomyces euteiches]